MTGELLLEIGTEDIPAKFFPEVLENLKKTRGPRFLHVITEKGKGYAPAEEDRESFHAVKPTDNKIEKKEAKVEKGKAYTDVFSDWICDKAEKDSDLHAITPAMCHGSGLVEFLKKFPDRTHFDLG